MEQMGDSLLSLLFRLTEEREALTEQEMGVQVVLEAVAVM